MSSTQSSQQETNSKKPDDDLELEETLSLCDLVICNNNNSTDDNYQYFSKEEEEFFGFFTTDLETSTKAKTWYSPERIIFGGKLTSYEGKHKAEKEQSGKRKLVKHDSVGSSSSKRHTNLLLILLGIPPKTQSEKEIMVDIRNRQSHHGPSTFFQSDHGSDKKVVHHPRVKKGFWRAVSVASCFGGQFMHT